ncbi:MAG: DUF362 domain-containing protein [Anaerolineae bacterium]|nr:DUF362 domain-containing protein [Anaerolineae bacterium]
MTITRRQFLRQTAALGLGAVGAGALLSAEGCGPQPATPAPTAGTGLSGATPALAPTAAGPGAAVTAQVAGPTATVQVASPTVTAQVASSTATAAGGGQVYLAAVHGADPAAITQRAIAALGGIERFVRPGDDVIVKPNICVAYHGPEYAATTNPQVVAALVSLCLGAGARRVRVMDFPFGGTAEQAYKISGIEDAVKAAGGEMEIMSSFKFGRTAIPEGKDIREWSVYQDALQAVLIDVPIAKHHGLARLTLGAKNLMGLIQDRGGIHRNMGQRLADLSSLFRPALTVVDAVRILMDNGPTGGDLNDVKQAGMVIASHDIVAADAYATRLFGLQPSDIAYIIASAEMGLGTSDLTGVRVEELSL